MVKDDCEKCEASQIALQEQMEIARFVMSEYSEVLKKLAEYEANEKGQDT